MMRLAFTIFLIVFSIGCRTVQTIKEVPPPLKPSPISELKKNIEALINDTLFIPSHVSIKIISLQDQSVLFEHDSKALLHPASNIKLFTSAAALSILDTNYKFKTAVYIDKNNSGKSTVDNIYIKGFGDPDLDSLALDSLAYLVKQYGITKITKDIVVDNSFFDNKQWGCGWAWDDDSNPNVPYISALSVNKNCIKISVISNQKSTFVFLFPSVNFINIINNSVVQKDSITNPIKIERLCINNQNTIIISGELPPFSQVTKKISICFPEIFVGMLFKESLIRAGINFKGNIIKGTIPEDAIEIAQYLQPIDKVITNLNKESDNLSAENVLKVISAIKYGPPGTSENGLIAVREFIANINIDTTKLLIADGSGVSRYNLMNTEQIIQFLSSVYEQPKIFNIFYNSLPIAGIDGTLKNRMMSYPTIENLRAKTGTLNGVSCLSGYVQTRDGEMLAFSIMMQNFITPVKDYRNIQDKICTLLANFTRRTN